MEVDTPEDVQDKASENLALLRKGSTDTVITWCTREELTNRNLSPETYKFLLAAHLMKGDSDEARLLWLRLPAPFKSDLELQRMWGIGRAILQDDYANAYIPAPNSLELLVLSSYRRRTLHSISVMYKSLALSEFQTMTGLADRDSACETIDSLGWRREESARESAQGRITEEFVFPVVPAACPSKTVIGLSELSSYISFLENV